MKKKTLLTREQFRELNRQIRELAKYCGIRYSGSFANFGKTKARLKLWLAESCSYQFMRRVYDIPFVKNVEYRLPTTGAVYPPCTPLSIYVEYKLERN